MSDHAARYVEELKYGLGPRKLEGVTDEHVTVQLEVLMRDAGGVTSMTGAELMAALEFYARSAALSFRVPLVISRSLFLDAVMHGIAFAGGLTAELRDGGDDVG